MIWLYMDYMALYGLYVFIWIIWDYTPTFLWDYMALYGFGPENVGLIFPMIASHFS